MEEVVPSRGLLVELPAMSNGKCSTIFAAGMSALLLVFVAARAERPEDDKRLSELIVQLGSRSFQEREQATKSLITAGSEDQSSPR